MEPSGEISGVEKLRFPGSKSRAQRRGHWQEQRWFWKRFRNSRRTIGDHRRWSVRRGCHPLHRARARLQTRNTPL